MALTNNEHKTAGSFDTSTQSRLALKIAALLSSIMFLAITVSGFLMYKRNVDLILMNLQDQLWLAANTIAINIDGDTYRLLQGKESVNIPEYREIRKILEQFVQFNSQLGFEPECVYTFRRVSKDSLEFTVMLQDQYVGNSYPVRPEMLPTWEKEIIRIQNKELREAYAKLDALNHSLQEANRLKSEFLSIAAYDLKNPLQVIMGFAELIANTPVDVHKSSNGKNRNGRIFFRVRDNGPGLTAEDLEKLFGKFMRLSAQPTGGESSTGLGLSIVKQVVELHGGKVWAESEGRGKGATFVVELS